MQTCCSVDDFREQRVDPLRIFLHPGSARFAVIKIEGVPHGSGRQRARGFNGVVVLRESHYRARAGSHGRVANLHIAEFDHFTEPLDSDDLNRLVAVKMGAG